MISKAVNYILKIQIIAVCFFIASSASALGVTPQCIATEIGVTPDAVIEPEYVEKSITVTDVMIVESGSEPNRVYNIAMVDEVPEFPGGEEAMYEWLYDKIARLSPIEAKSRKVRGKTDVEFKVSKVGEVIDVKCLSNIDESVERFFIYVFKSMPRWKPGRNAGENVTVTYKIPISFNFAD